MSVILSRNGWDCRSLSLSAADDTEVKPEMSSSNTTENLDERSDGSDGQSESGELEEEVEHFKEFLNKVQDCLAGRSRETGRC